jgi:4-amino-4-deoxy-L-arabinose transferase-like glycosyltransferase
MLALLLPLEGLLIYLLWRCLRSGRDWRESIMVVYVAMGVLITLSTELLGVFHALTDVAIRSFWLAVLVVTLFLVFWVRRKINFRSFSLKIGGKFEWAILFTISAYFLFTLFIALVAPPNTNDSLQYHMSRVMHWIVNRSVGFYATPIDRQLWMPPFAEYSILHLFLLAGNDRFVNLVQWFSMAGSAVVVSLIAGQIGVKPRGQWFAALFAVTIPMGILQSTSTQTDYVAGFLCLCVLYFAISEIQKYILGGKAGISLNFVLLGFSLGLAVLTKGTVYAFVFPILLCYGIILIWKHLWKIIPGMVLIGGVCVLSLNAPAWFRNYSIYGSILGPGAGSLGSSSYGPEMVFSTAVKDATNQLALPVGPGNKAMFIVVTKIHQILGIDINDPRISLDDYRIRFSYQEDYAGNPGHFLFWFLSAVMISIIFVIRLFYPPVQAGSKLNRVMKDFDQPINWAFFYNLILIAGYFLFALLFKWQSYNSRLILPLLIAVGPFGGWVSDAIRPRIVFVIFTALFAIGGLRYLLANPSRPLISVGENTSILLASRTDVQFYNSPEIRDSYISVVAAAKDYDCGSIGLELDSSTPEYLIWYILAANHLPIDQVKNISSTPETSRLIDPAYRPCVVFCNTCSLIMKDKNYQEVYNRGSLELFVNRSRQ